jgi:hypothetical protein
MMPVRRRSLVLLAAAALLVALPVRAQSPDAADAPPSTFVAYDDISFLMAEDIATSVNITRLAGDAPDVGPLAPGPPSLRFSLYGEAGRPLPGGQHGEMTFLRAADLEEYPATVRSVNQLIELLNARPDLAAGADGSPDELPILEDVGAAQAIRFLPTYLDTESLSGVVFVTAFTQDAYPFSRDSFVAIFQGISADGSTVVSASIPLIVGSFPKEPTAEQIDRVLAGDWDGYLRRSLRRLAETPADGFSPSIASIGTLFESITFSDAAAATPQASAQPAPPAG